MGQANRILGNALVACGLAGTPVLMFVCYNLFAGPAGANIQLHDIASDYTEGVAVALILLAVIVFLPIPAAHRRALGLLWLVRMGIALGAMLAYEATLVGDFIGYYNRGTALSRPFALFKFGAGTANIDALVGVFAMATDSYNAIKVIFSFIGLIAVYLFYRAAAICVGDQRISLLYVLGLFPSILFWSSLFGKEPVVLLGIAIYCYGVAAMIVQRRAAMIVLVITGLAIASAIRIWLGVIFFAPVLVTYVMASRTPVLGKLAFLLVAVPVFLVAVQGFVDRFELETTRDLVSRTDYLSSAWAHGGAAQQIQGGFGSLRDMIAFMPLGGFTALFRPLPLEVRNPFGTLAGLENAFLLWLFVIGLFRRGLGWISQPILLWAAVTLIVWAGVYGFVSYQNLGGGFRYRAQVTPILLMLGLYLAYAHHLGGEVSRRLRRPPLLAGAPPKHGESQEQA